MARAWVDDRWLNDDRSRSSRHGQGSRWRVRWWDESVNDNGHVSRKQKSKSFRVRPEAEAFASKIENDLRSGVYRDPALGEALYATVANDWLGSLADVKPVTLRRYERELRTYIFPRFGDRRIATITRQDAVNFVSDLAGGRALAVYAVRGANPPRNHPVQPMKQPLSPSSVEHVAMVFAAVLGWAVEVGIIVSNPAAKLRTPRREKRARPYLTHGDVERLATAAGEVDGPMSETLVRTLAYSGLRIGEALALQISDVNLLGRRLQVRQTWTEDRAGRRVLGPPKTHEARRVPIPRFLVDDLAGLCAGGRPDDFLFRAPRGGPVSVYNWRQRVWRYAVSDAGFGDLENLTPHALRHTAASLAIASGADVKVIQSMLGHADASITLNTYADLWPDKLDTVSDLMEAGRAEALRVVPDSHVVQMWSSAK